MARRSVYRNLFLRALLDCISPILDASFDILVDKIGRLLEPQPFSQLC